MPNMAIWAGLWARMAEVMVRNLSEAKCLMQLSTYPPNTLTLVSGEHQPPVLGQSFSQSFHSDGSAVELLERGGGHLVLPLRITAHREGGGRAQLGGQGRTGRPAVLGCAQRRVAQRPGARGEHP